MGPLVSILDKYVFPEITGSLAWEALLVIWEKMNKKDWSTIYFESFIAAIDELRPQLAKYSDNGLVDIDVDRLNLAFSQKLRIDIETTSLSDLSNDLYLNSLAEILYKEHVLMIGGNNLSKDDYVSVLHTVVYKSKELFTKSIIENDRAFREAILKETTLSNELIKQLEDIIGCIDQNLSEKLDNVFKEIESLRPQGIKSFEEVLNYSHAQLSRYYKQITEAVNPEGTSIFDARLYTSRTEFDRVVERFLESDEKALILIGDSGLGKTNSLCGLTKSLFENNHALFFYNLGSSVKTSIIEEISIDLATSPNEIMQRLNEINQICIIEEKVALFIFDGLNEFRGGKSELVGGLLNEIDNFISRIQYENIKFIISCRKNSWDHLISIGLVKLIWSNYYKPFEKFWYVIDYFTENELDKAFTNYQEVYKLSQNYSDLSDFTKESCKDPFLLKLLCETHRGEGKLISKNDPQFDVFRRYYKIKAPRISHKLFVEKIVEIIYHQKQDRLSLSALYEDSDIKRIILSDELDSPYLVLKDNGLLTEFLGADDNIYIKFTYDRVLEYLLANYLMEIYQGDSNDWINQIAFEAKSFFPLWGATKYILSIQSDSDTFILLAESDEITSRAIVVETLADIQIIPLDISVQICLKLLSSQESRAIRTALEASYRIGKSAKEVFMTASSSFSDETRNIVKWYLYILWQEDPGFCLEIIDELISKISIFSYSKSRSIASLSVDFWSTIFMNNCWDPVVIQKISDQIHRLFVDKLQLERLSKMPFFDRLEAIGFAAGSRAFSKKIADVITFGDIEDIDAFLGAEDFEKECYRDLVPFLIPESVLTDKEIEKLIVLLNSKSLIYKVLPIIIIIGHILKDYDRNQPIFNKIFEEVPVNSQYWLICGFSIFLPIDFTNKYYEYLYMVTTEFMEERFEEILHPSFQNLQFIDSLDILLLPISLTSYKLGLDNKLIRDLYQQSISSNNIQLKNRIYSMLAPVAIYYPDEVLDILSSNINVFKIEIENVQLIKLLSTIRTLYSEKVDVFLDAMNIDIPTKKIVFSSAKFDIIDRCIYGIGLYNNIINMLLWHPSMRDTYALELYNLLGNSTNIEELVGRYSWIIYDFFKENDWTIFNFMDFEYPNE